MMYLTLLFLSVILCDRNIAKVTDPYTNEIVNDRMLLVLSAPSVHDPYYRSAFPFIVDFQINYANKIMEHDNVVVIVDADTRPYYANTLPDDVLLTADIDDIWLRDFTTVNPNNPIQFRYTWASMSQQKSVEVQDSFQIFADQYVLPRRQSNLLLDGGNIVDNYHGQVITTTKFMTDNQLSYVEAKQALVSLLDATAVAILEADENVLGHSDGMVMWLGENMLLVNDYSSDMKFRSLVIGELTSAFPNTTIIEVPVRYTQNKPGQWDGFESACGINLNAVLTFQNIYVPIFNMSHDQAVVDIIRNHTTKKVITVNAEGVCPMGGSIRCLTWQLMGENAENLIIAARRD